MRKGYSTLNSTAAINPDNALSVYALSEILWAQLVCLRITCPSYDVSLKNDDADPLGAALLPEAILESHHEVASRILEHDVSIQSIKLRGDLYFTSSCVTQMSRSKLQDVATRVFNRHPSIENSFANAENSGNQLEIDVHLSRIFPASSELIYKRSVFPDSFLLLGNIVTSLRMVNCGLTSLSLSIGYHFSSLLVRGFKSCKRLFHK